MKRLLAFFFAMGMAIVTMSCIDSTVVYAFEPVEDFVLTMDDLHSITSMEELEDAIEAQVKSAIQSLSDCWDTFSGEIDTYDKYVENADRVTKFYEMFKDATKQICEVMREDSVIYANLILSSDESVDDKYEDADDIYDHILKGVCDDIYDDLFEDILEDMYDTYFDGILDDAYYSHDFSAWSSVSSKEYTQWSEASSTVYEEIISVKADIYAFYLQFKDGLYRNDIEAAEKEITKLSDKIVDVKDRGSSSYSSADNGNTNADTNDNDAANDYENNVVDDDDYSNEDDDKGKQDDPSELVDSDKEGYYTSYVATDNLNVRSLPSTESTILGKILQGDSVHVYDIKDGWATITYADAIAYVSADYIEEAPEMDSSEDVSSLDQGAVKQDEMNIRDLEIKEVSESVETEMKEVSDSAETEMKEVNESEPEAIDAHSESSSGIRPEFKEFWDNYEDFYMRYYDILDKYENDPGDYSIMTDYIALLGDLQEWDDKADEWDDADSMTLEEYNYMVGVTARIYERAGESIYSN